MHPRLRLTLFTLLGLALLFAVLAIALAVSSSDRDRQDAAIVHNQSPFKGAERPKIPTKGFSLSDQNGRMVSMEKLRGRTVVVSFMYTTCEDSCPLQAKIIVGALEKIGRKSKQVTALAVSVDPKNDTPVLARSFLNKYRARGRINFLLGKRVTLQRIWDEYGVQPQGEGFDHSASIVLVDSKGRQRVGHSAHTTSPESLAHDLRLLIREK